ncbi:hypothetical protein B296_00002592 [Ensete ventricosum]|uniref:Uncharacterized protein n=1 Tax=Ensete ventricosum TaxID=4639 RepID=A0A427BCH5_ENSVE|nr:hypothetical protein B296_00002592 [Ensete ventricosum]
MEWLDLVSKVLIWSKRKANDDDDWYIHHAQWEGGDRISLKIFRSDGEDEGVLACSFLAAIHMIDAATRLLGCRISLSAHTTRLSAKEEEKKTEEK